jgi:hypothetical protein
MSATLQRDQAATLAKTSPAKALEKARCIEDPWFRAQALACVARHASGKAVAIAREAARAAGACDDAYKQAAVRAWEIAALAETGNIAEATKSWAAALATSRKITPSSSRAEALMLIAQAAASISTKQRDETCDELRSACGADVHWRCKRAVRDALALKQGRMQPRSFFW